MTIIAVILGAVGSIALALSKIISAIVSTNKKLAA